MPLAFIPNFEFPSLHLGPFVVQSFGVLAGLGIFLAVWIASRTAKRDGQSDQVILDFAVVGVVSGVVAGHLAHLFLYHPEELQGWAILRIWEGLSSMGGLFGGILAAVIWFRWKGIRFAPYADALALGVAPGWGVARAGCFTVHDHPGVRTDFFLAVDFPSGPRHDLGLYEAVLLFALGALLWALHRRGVLRGYLLSLLALLYGLGRFGLDFLRTRELVDVGSTVMKPDARYLGLTPAQYAALMLIAWGTWRLATRRRDAGPSTTPAAG
ncbi:MAG: prolipoprotein diacylglyceryl transferase [Anaeromyxobacter sp.]